MIIADNRCNLDHDFSRPKAGYLFPLCCILCHSANTVLRAGTTLLECHLCGHMVLPLTGNCQRQETALPNIMALPGAGLEQWQLLEGSKVQIPWLQWSMPWEATQLQSSTRTCWSCSCTCIAVYLPLPSPAFLPSTEGCLWGTPKESFAQSVLRDPKEDTSHHT